MFLTRIGFGSKAVVTGDISQVDLPSGKRSGLRVVREILEGIEGVAFCTCRPATWCATTSCSASSRPTRPSRSQRDEAVREAGTGADGGLPRRRAGRSRSTVTTSSRSPATCSPRSAVPDDMELSLLLVDERHHRGLNAEHMGKPRGRPTCWPSRSTSPGRRRPDRRRSSATSCCAPRSRTRRPPDLRSHAAHEVRLLTVHGILHLLGMDHADADGGGGDVRAHRRAAGLLRAAERGGLVTAVDRARCRHAMLLTAWAYLAATETVLQRLGLVRALRLSEEEARGRAAAVADGAPRHALNVLLVLTVLARVRPSSPLALVGWMVPGGALGGVGVAVGGRVVTGRLVVGRSPRGRWRCATSSRPGCRLAPSSPRPCAARPARRVFVDLGRLLVRTRQDVAGPYPTDDEVSELLSRRTRTRSSRRTSGR
jgi:hypothetical protein